MKEKKLDRLVVQVQVELEQTESLGFGEPGVVESGG